ncbi:MAG: isoleucyl-tRNA synthetase [Microgenomates group bacterium Gr01-1014_16]|nr:MAG: isoleucyl-tRNA synthetase [Microgenomates group bacterium Gr01-1014_16]
MAFKPITSQVDFPALEKEILKWWYESGVVDKYLHKNDNSKKKFSFLDGPITANNPMGVHHAWGRTYKDLWQRYFNLKGYKQRFQNGFDCQGLWVEVEVEKDLGFKSKKDIETYGVDKFVNKCKDRVMKYSAIQAEQSKRLGYFMDWENSYYTMSDANNYAIWHFLKVCWERGWLYKGHDSVPWCPRCETAISQHEILTEDYQELIHESVYLKFPLVNNPGEFLLVWTTTPWTIPANIAVAVEPSFDYSLVENCWVASDATSRLFPSSPIQKTLSGKKLVGLKYTGPYDNLEAVQKAASHRLFHTVVATDSKIMPINSQEGTGLVHTAVSAGEEDFKLGQKLDLPMVPVIADNADYLPGLGDLTGLNAKKHPELILDYLKTEHWTLKTEHYTHRYPACWRCKTELVWKVADEWYISMDKPDDTGKSLRKQMMAIAKKIKWLPAFGLDRELDWLKNMHDWLISKKNRYWGLALPIYECTSCHHFEVIGSKEELKSKCVTGWDKFDGNSPHRPWIDEVKTKCSQCGNVVSRVSDVGNPWLDAGIVSFSTLPPDWFPADFITESFPGQFKNWFYSLIAMSTVLAKTNSMKTVLGFASACGTDGEIMHKSNPKTYISFDEGADKAGVDVMRWIFATQNPTQNLLFGWELANDTRRQFHLMLWNIYNFFVTYSNIDKYSPNKISSPKSVLDQWILSRLNQTISVVTKSLDKYDAYTASHAIENFVNDLSLWYVRRSRDRVGPSAPNGPDKQTCYSVLHFALCTLSSLLAPFTPYLSEEIYRNLTGETSVHLSSWPKVGKIDFKLIGQMRTVRKIVELGLSARKAAGIKVRQPLRSLTVNVQNSISNIQLEKLILDELNIKNIIFEKSDELSVELDLKLDDLLIAEGQTRELIRQIQDKRKELGARLDQKINLVLPSHPVSIEDLKRHTLADKIEYGSELKVELL